ncbi:putative uncharacterized protein DDB_G0282133 [Condylostylus longicornis]|uniref:putative uncharacterized protein DDB_G0282133 n=1 Tax=Condylostylus longicornis TaxID=2530218 RepID=UPI00244E0920|nr:putative uncharacterized protein DDB_G0282133 [Condylostylus longicornis]
MPFVQRIVTPTFLSRSYGKGKAGFALQQQIQQQQQLTQQKLQKGSGTNVCNYCRATATTSSIKATTTSTPSSSSSSSTSSPPSSSSSSTSTSNNSNVVLATTTSATKKNTSSPSTIPSINARDNIDDNNDHDDDDRRTINQNENQHHNHQKNSCCTCTTNELLNSKIHNNINDEVDDGGLNANNITSYTNSNSTSSSIVNGKEFETISNITLTNCLRQLASVVIIANDIFLDLNTELQRVSCRTQNIKQKILALEDSVSKYNPKEIEVPESDFETFIQIKEHFKSKLDCEKHLFIKETRPRNVQNLYEAAGRSPAYTDSVDLVDTTTNYKENNTIISNNIRNESSFEKKILKIDTEIEIRLPANINKLRKWTSLEALGDVTVTPDCMSKVGSFLESDQINIIPSSYQENPSTYTKFNDIGTENDIPIDHLLPSPEEQCQLIANKYPAELIPVDITGRRFDRMCLSRKSVYADSKTGSKKDNKTKDDTEKRTRTKKSRGKRRNTIIGIDPKEISEAIQGDENPDQASSETTPVKSISERSKSSDLLKNKEISEPGKSTLSRLNSLKNWGRNRLKFADRQNDDNNKRNKNSNYNPSEADSEADEIKLNTTITNNYSNVNKNRKRFFEKGKNYFSSTSNNEQKNNNNRDKIIVNYFKSESTSTSNSPESTATVASSPSPHHRGYNSNSNQPLNSVKLRESSSLRRQRRNDSSNINKDEPHSSSGNWSASSESGRASIGSEITILPKSSASSISLNHNNSYQSFGTSGPPSSVVSRRRFLNTSASSSITSEGPSTPDPQLINDICFIDDETSSAYSCDTEGYYTSFHIDSGLKTLKEEEPVTPLHSTSALSSNNSIGTLLNQTGESEYELFGRGSTSTTASSAGTVCTTLLTGNENDLNSISFSEVGENKLSYSSSNCSSSTAVSTLERGGTIKRNSKILHKELVEVTVHLERECEKIKNEEKNIIETSNLGDDNLKSNINEDNECAEYSDVESNDRSERIRQKTAISSSRIPSMCIITPTTSDDENVKSNPVANANNVVQYAKVFSREQKEKKLSKEDLNNRNIIELPNQASPSLSRNSRTSYDEDAIFSEDENLYDLTNEFVEPIKLVRNDEEENDLDIDISFEKDIYHTIGEYVTLADVSNNNKMPSVSSYSKTNSFLPNSPHRDLDYSSNTESEYVSLKELPQNLISNKTSGHFNPFAFGTIEEEPSEKINNNINAILEQVDSDSDNSKKSIPQNKNSIKNFEAHAHQINTDTINEKKASNILGDMRVSFNAQGKIIYNSDSLRRQKRGHTTFLPGPHVKDADSALSLSSSSTKTTSSSVTTQFSNNSNEENKNEFKNISAKDKYKNSLKRFISGGCANRELKDIRPVNSNNKNNNNNLYHQKQEEQARISSNRTRRITKNIDSDELTLEAKREMQETKEFQNLLQTKNEPFNRNAQIYGTLPRKDIIRNTELISLKQQTPLSTNIYRSPVNLPKTISSLSSSSATISPIVPCNKSSFRTSTPSKLDNINDVQEQQQDFKQFSTPPRIKTIDLQSIRPKPSNSTDAEEIPNTCSDRLGTAKTSLMDFKKLLLAKSTKTSISSNSKMSAVELLKASKQNTNSLSSSNKIGTSPISSSPTTISTGAGQKANPTGLAKSGSLSSSMLLLELSRSPRQFANRRMIRQGQFGSPSKYIISGGAKKRNYALGNSIGTDVMSTTIPEANKEEDSTSSSGSISSQKSSTSIIDNKLKEKSDSVEHIDFKKNFFFQSEENNFTKNEIDASKYRCHLSQYRQDVAKAIKNEMNVKQNIAGTTVITTSTGTTVVTNITNEASTAMTKPPAFETSL